MKIRAALSGSGFLAPIHAGAVCAFLDNGIEIAEVSGTSGGSIVGAILASGMTSAQIKQIALDDLPDGIVAYRPISLFFHEGLNSGDILQSWLDSILGNVTFATAKIPISIMATDIDAGESFRFDAVNTPNITLAQACRASASVPIVYVPAEVAGKKLCDAGMVCNIPVDQLIDDAIVRVGFEVMDGSPAGSTSNMFGLFEQCIKTMMQSNEENLTAWAEHTGSIIQLEDAMPYGFLDASLPLSAKLELFERGYTAGKRVIERI